MSKIFSICKNLFEIFSCNTHPLRSTQAKKAENVALSTLSSIETIRDNKLANLVSLFPAEKQRGLEILLGQKNLSTQIKIDRIIPQLPLFCRFELAIIEALELSSKEDITRFCASQGALHTYCLPESSFLLMMILMDLDKKTEGLASKIYYANCSDKMRTLKHLVLELNLNKTKGLSEVDAIESILDRPLLLGERLLLAMRAARKVPYNKTDIYNFCKRDGELREFRLPNDDPGLHRVLQDLDKETSGFASKTYLSS